MNGEEERSIEQTLYEMWYLAKNPDGIHQLSVERCIGEIADLILNNFRINVVNMNWDCPTYIGRLENKIQELKYDKCFVISYDNIRVMFDNAKKYDSPQKFTKDILKQLEILGRDKTTDAELCKVTFFER